MTVLLQCQIKERHITRLTTSDLLSLTRFKSLGWHLNIQKGNITRRRSWLFHEVDFWSVTMPMTVRLVAVYGMVEYLQCHHLEKMLQDW